MTLQILLVDDNLTFLASVNKSLNLIPGLMVVGEAHDGAQALALAQSLKPDLVLLDIVMPGLSGLDVAKAMQAWPCSPRVLFCRCMTTSLIDWPPNLWPRLGL
jgi:DNA-binding NarL/FixJ family response regulator